jgi:mono/diheme cytochrome c family protein
MLLRITKQGPAAVVGGGYQSDMPGFGNVMNDGEIRAVIAFIKSTWPEREREYQAEMSRGERETTQ